MIASVCIAPGLACDLCGCYQPPQQVIGESHGGFFTAVSEQFTHFGTDRQDGREVGNPTGQNLDSSITQFLAGWRFNDRFSLQVSTPYIYRSFKRPVGFDIENGHVHGIGDISLLANFFVLKKEALFQNTPTSGKECKSAAGPEKSGPDFSTTLNLIAGLKAPTGDSSRIKEEFNESDVEDAPPSGIHGHDLTLGTGSWDGVFGVLYSMRYKSVFLRADAQFTLRSASPYSYRFANDLTWSGGPGWYFLRSDNASFAMQFVISGEYKGRDTFQGQPAEDTGVTALYLGPRITAAFGRFDAEVGVDLPVVMHTTAFQTTADYRIRAGFTWRF